MTEKQAVLLTKELRELFRGEQVILVESREWENFVPRHVSLVELGKISSVQEKENYVLNIVIDGPVYTGLDNPTIYLKTIFFTTLNLDGKKFYRSFTLAREWKDDQEIAHWSRLQFALL